jgi:hypothetical protein
MRGFFVLCLSPPELQENPAEGVPGQLVFWEKFEMDIRKIQSRFCHHC